MPLVPLTLVTGASSGIGREIAIQLSASRSILIHGRDQLRLNETLALCAPGKHRLWNFDLESVTTLRSSLLGVCEENESVVSEFIHCAGIPSVGGARLMSASKIQKVFNKHNFCSRNMCNIIKENESKCINKYSFCFKYLGNFRLGRTYGLQRDKGRIGLCDEVARSRTCPKHSGKFFGLRSN